MLWVSIAMFAASLAGCGTGGTDATIATSASPSTTTTTATTPIPTSADGLGDFAFDPFVLTVNVDITDTGYEPSSVFVPAGRAVLLVLRNRTRSEHHFRVVDMEVTDLFWQSQPDMEIQEGVSEGDHLLHHQSGFVDWRGTSPAGVTPTLDQVHGYAAGGVNDAVRFVALNPGTYAVDDPLHPEYAGTITVFE